jgi:hypothetical protein
MHGEKRERVLRVILNEPGGSLTKYRVAKLAKISTAWTQEYFNELEKKGITKGTKVVDVEAAYKYWESIARVRVFFDFFVNSPKDFLRESSLKYAVTTYQAENLINHYLFVSRVDAYVLRKDLPLWKERIVGNGLTGKGNLRLMIADEPTLYGKQKVNDLWLVSTPQLLLDLRREGGVCREAYDMMVAKNVR